jgi:hypothetical protein
MRIRNIHTSSGNDDTSQTYRRAACVWHLARYATLAVCSVVSVTGCACPKQSPQQLQARLQSATLIGNDWSRDLALTAIARDAACAGNHDICEKAAQQIQADALRDKTLASCAQQLKNLGQQAEAENLAIQVESDNARDNILAWLAESPQARPKLPK